MEDTPRRRGFDGLSEMWSRRRALAFVAFALPFSIVAAAAAFLPDVYRSTAIVIVEHDEVKESFVKTTVASELETRIRTLSQETLSRARLAPLIERFGLYPSMRGRASEDAIVEQMRKDITIDFKEVAPAGGGRGATISFGLTYQGRDPRLVAAVANTLAASYVQQNTRSVERQTSNTTKFLKAQLDEMKKRHDEQERRVREFKMRHSGDLPEQMAPNLATLERLNTRLYMNRDNQQRVQERRETLLRGIADAGRPGLAPGTFDSAVTRLARLRAELAELRARYSERYPEVVRVKEEIAQLEKGGDVRPAGKGKAEQPSEDPVARTIKDSLSSIDNEMRILKAEEQRLQESIAAYQTRVDVAPHRDQEFRELSRDYEATKEMYTSLLNRYEEAQMAENMTQVRQGEQFRVLDPAAPSRVPTAPNRTQLLLIGSFLCLALTAGMVVLAEQRDTSFHTVDDLRGFTSVPVLISIPKIVTRTDVLRRRARVSLGALALTLAMALLVAGTWSFTHKNEELVRLLARGASRSVST
jgi:polysaccharide chain length determinant protein (PEP-CTERM system associated)